MASPSPRQRIIDTVVNIRKAHDYIAGLSQSAFEQSDVVQDAVLRRLQNASEAITRLRAEHPADYERLTRSYPNVNWQRFRGLGDRYRHGYDVIDTDLVWHDLSSGGITGDVLTALASESAFLTDPPA